MRQRMRTLTPCGPLQRFVRSSVNARNANVWCRPAAWLLAVVVCCNSIGCSRAFWRMQADERTYSVLSERQNDSRWQSPRLDIEPDPRSRFYDPYDPDSEPLPPDDPAAHEYMHQVAGMRGSESWHELGRTFSVENPHWLEQFGLTPEMTQPDDRAAAGDARGTGDSDASDGQMSQLPGIDNLTLPQSLELSYIHNRSYQTQIEELYLSALDLTFERFRFDVRHLGIGGRKPSSTLAHTTIPEGENSLGIDNRFGVSQLLPTGGQWIVELANNTLWMFTGQNQTNSASVLSYSIVQPLLLGGGRLVTLENLTQSERDVLYETRDLARFRKQFFTSTVAGGQTFVSSRGSFGQSRGFLGLLQLWQNVINQAGNVQRLAEQAELQRALASQKPESISEPLPALPPGLVIPPQLSRLSYDVEAKLLSWRGEMTTQQETLLRGLSQDPAFVTAIGELIQRLRTETVTLSVAQLESDLASSRTSLRESEQRYQDSLDRYKVLDLGLPPDMPMSIDNSLLKPFELIDPRLPAVENLLKRFVEVWAALDEDDPDLAELRTVATALKQLEDTVQVDGIDVIAEDFGRVRQLIQSEANAGPPVPGESRRFETEEQRQRTIKDIGNDDRLFSIIKKDFRVLVGESKTMRETLTGDNVILADRKRFYTQIAQLRENLLKLSQSLQVIQIGLRVELIPLQSFTLSSQNAVQIALANRLDLMNERARVTDSRRQVEIRANELEAVLDIVAEGDLGSLGGSSHFKRNQSSFRAGVSFTAPLDQVAERNNYRAAQIEYQRARRRYMTAEDQVRFEIRQSWRQISILRQNFETARQAIRIAALQFDSAVEESTAPVQAGQASRNQSLNLLNALRDVLRAQNDLIRFWVDYERNRLNIHRDMGTMEIDAAGVWNDNFYQQLMLPPAPAAADGDGNDPQAAAGSKAAVVRATGLAVQAKQGRAEATELSSGQPSSKNAGFIERGDQHGVDDVESREYNSKWAARRRSPIKHTSADSAVAGGADSRGWRPRAVDDPVEPVRREREQR